MVMLFDADVPVHHGFVDLLGAADEPPDLLDSRAGQVNGLVGAAVPGRPFDPPAADLVIASFQDTFELRLPVVRSLRARCCASGMDAAQEADTVLDDEPTIDRYLLSLWPAAGASRR